MVSWLNRLINNQAVRGRICRSYQFSRFSHDEESKDPSFADSLHQKPKRFSDSAGSRA